MKKFLFWVAKIFNVDLVETKVVNVETIKYIVDGYTIKGNVTIEGNLTVVGSLEVKGNVSCVNK